MGSGPSRELICVLPHGHGPQCYSDWVEPKRPLTRLQHAKNTRKLRLVILTVKRKRIRAAKRDLEKLRVVSGARWAPLRSRRDVVRCTLQMDADLAIEEFFNHDCDKKYTWIDPAELPMVSSGNPDANNDKLVLYLSLFSLRVPSPSFVGEPRRPLTRLQ